jgi:hypothetical protein
VNLFDVPVELALGLELLVAKLTGVVRGVSFSGLGSGGSFFHFFYYKFVGTPYLFDIFNFSKNYERPRKG